jgi:hypothetical protein
VSADLGFENSSDFADVFELGKDLLVVAAALGRSPGAHEAGEFGKELHGPASGALYLIFFLEVVAFLCTSRNSA